MKVNEILGHYGFKPKTVKESKMDATNQSWTTVEVDNDKVVLGYSDVHADDKKLLLRNLDANLEHYTMLGPLALFAFKIRGPAMAIYMISMIPLGGQGYKIMRFNRYQNIADDHDDLLVKFIEWSKQGLQTESSDYFNIWKTVKALEG